MDHCYCGETHSPELDEVIRTQRLNPRKACRRWQQGRRICHQCGFLVNLTQHSSRCRIPARIPELTNYDETHTTLPNPEEPRKPNLPASSSQRELQPTQALDTERPPEPEPRSPYYPLTPGPQPIPNHRRTQEPTHLSDPRSLVGASALERGLMSRINNDMLIGAMVASAITWALGITVTVWYLATTGRRE